MKRATARLIVLVLLLTSGMATVPIGAAAVDYNLPSLWGEYDDYFIMGTFGGWNTQHQLYHYRTNSPANALKLDSQIGNNGTNSVSRQTYLAEMARIDADTEMTDGEKDAARQAANENVVLAANTGAENTLRQIQQYNATNNLPDDEKKVVRAHVLAWHGGQQPTYFFCNGFVGTGSGANATCPNGWASPETMLARLDTYIKKMMDKYAQYNDIIYSWDVVNEPLDDYSGQIRNFEDYQPGQWGRVFRRPELDGDPDARLYAESVWVRQAFASARQWSDHYGADWKLYFNDFQDSNKLYEPKMSQSIKMLEPIYAAGNIDGYGMQARLAWAYPTIDMLREQIEAGLTVADEISISESDIRSDFEPNPFYDPNQPTRRVAAGDSPLWVPNDPNSGSGSLQFIGSANGNTFDVHNSPVRRRVDWGTAGNNTLATNPEVMRKQADFAADWMDLLIEYKDVVVAYQWDGTSDTSTFNRTTGGHLWAGTFGTPEKYSFFAVIGAPNRDKLRQALSAAATFDEDEYTAGTWANLEAATAAGESLVDTRIYTMAGVQAVKDATDAIQQAIDGLERPAWCGPGYWLNAQDAAWALTGASKTDLFNTTVVPDAYDTHLAADPTLAQTLRDAPYKSGRLSSGPFGLKPFEATAAYLTENIPGYGFDLSLLANEGAGACPIDLFGSLKG
jgi:GH35 family endo-1,4-beta-xylanase